MPIVTADLKKYLTGAASDGGAQASPGASLGNYRGSTEPTSGADNALFDDVSGAEASTGHTDYRCLCFKNTHGSLSLQGAKVWVSTDEANASTAISIAVEVPAGSATAGNAQTIANETTAPTVNAGNVSNWVASASLNSYANGIAININGHSADLGPGEIVFVWIRRVISAGASAAAAVSFTCRIQGDTAA